MQVSFETPEYTANSDALGPLRLLEAIRILKMEDRVKFYQASTSELYGNAPSPQNESTPFAPRSPYAAAKLYAYWMTVNYREAYGIFASNGILFNHESPIRGHFIADGVWDAVPLETELLIQADRLVGGKDAMLVIDDTSMPKKGDRSVGVAPQYASALGKTANCQTLVSLTLARGEVPVMVALRLFIPESWTSNVGRLKRAGVPVEYRTVRTKPEIAVQLIIIARCKPRRHRLDALAIAGTDQPRHVKRTHPPSRLVTQTIQKRLHPTAKLGLPVQCPVNHGRPLQKPTTHESQKN